jgi:alkylation response protein AidB-like acyl-CoA dehydrogenase
MGTWWLVVGISNVCTGPPSERPLISPRPMRVALTDEQEFLREAVEGVVARDAPLARVREWAEECTPQPADAIAARQGWTGIGLEEQLGGQGGDAIELMVLAEGLGRGAAPWDRLLGGCLALQLLAACHGQDASALAKSTAEGEEVAVLCVDGRRAPASWPASVIDRHTVRMAAEYVPGAAGAAQLVLPVPMDDGLHLLVVPPAAPGVLVVGQPLVDRTRALARVEIDGAEFLDLGGVPDRELDRVASLGAVLVAADALGAASRMLELTTEYITDRRQFGVPVGSFQAVKHAAAEMLVDVEASRSAVRYAAWAVSARSEEAAVWASIAKSYACAAAARVADKALFLHGAIGYTWEHDLQYLFKRAKSDERLFGSPGAHLDLIADRLALVGVSS